MSKEPEYEINKEIVFSTGHAGLQDMQKLKPRSLPAENKIHWLHYDTYEYGVRIYVVEDAVEYARDAGFSEAFIHLVEIAREKGCKWLVLDCDGPSFEHLERFDW